MGWVQKAVEGAGDRRFLGICLASRRTSALSGRDEGEHPLDVPGHGDEAPFAARAREAGFKPEVHDLILKENAIRALKIAAE